MDPGLSEFYTRGWDGWMASSTRWTWVWVNSGSWWWTGRPGVLRFMGSQRVGHDWATELNWTDTSRALWSFPCGSAGKESACSAGGLGSVPGLGRSPGKGKCHPLQYSGLYSPCGLWCGDHTPLLVTLDVLFRELLSKSYLPIGEKQTVALGYTSILSFNITNCTGELNPKSPRQGNLMIILLKVAPLKRPSLMSTYDVSYHLVLFWLIVFPQWKCSVWGVDCLVPLSSMDYSFWCL